MENTSMFKKGLLSSHSLSPTKTYTQIKGKFVILAIFDPTKKPSILNPSDEDKKDAKLLFYYPNDTLIEEKRRQIGMMEGLSLFTSEFTGSTDLLKSVHLKQHSVVIKQWEPNIWIFMVYRNARNITMKGNDVIKTEWIENTTQDISLYPVLNNLCNIFNFLHGQITSYLTKLDKLVDILEDFVPTFFETLEEENINIFKELEGFHYGPISSTTALSIQTFVNFLKILYPKIHHISLLYDGYLLFTGLSMEDMKTLYCYLVTFNGKVNSRKLMNYPFNRMPTAASEPGGGSSTFGRAHFLESQDGYLMGLMNSMIFAPLIHLSDGSVKRLLTLLYKKFMILLILDNIDDVDEKYLESLKNSVINMPGGLNFLINPISEQIESLLSKEDLYRFIYFNQANYAIRISNKQNVGIEGEIISKSEIDKMGEIFNMLKFPNKSKNIQNKHKYKQNMYKNNQNIINNYEQNFKQNRLINKQNDTQIIDNEQNYILNENKQSDRQNVNKQNDIQNLNKNEQKDIIPNVKKNEKNDKQNSNKNNQNDIKNTIQTNQIDIQNLNISEQEDSQTALKFEQNDMQSYTQLDLQNDIYSNINDIDISDFEDNYNNDKNKNLLSVSIKASKSGWLNASVSLDRMYYLFIDNPKLNIEEAEEETKQFLNTHFSNIYI